jgi:hypothetical protein
MLRRAAGTTDRLVETERSPENSIRVPSVARILSLPHSITVGTRKLSAFRRGALASAASRGRDGPRTSSRNTLRTSIPWASGSTSRVSSSWSRSTKWTIALSCPVKVSSSSGLSRRRASRATFATSSTDSDDMVRLAFSTSIRVADSGSIEPARTPPVCQIRPDPSRFAIQPPSPRFGPDRDGPV